MAIRNMRFFGDDLLRKKSKPVKDISPKIIQLLDDMGETLRSQQGLGLAAPQVGVLKRVVVIDFGEEQGLLEFINPEIVEANGEQRRSEACLSIPGRAGIVPRPEYVKVRATNRHGNDFEIEGREIFAVALCHEIDHLNGILYVDKAEEMEELGTNDE